MATVYITGHRNPDMDSVASAWCYARLKNKIDNENTYIPAVLGPLNRVSRSLFDKLQLAPPVFLQDAYTKVSSIVRKPSLVLSPQEPVYELVNLYNQSNPSVVPIIDDEGDFKGLLSVDDINRYFLRENRDSRPVYDFFLANIPRVLHGHYLKKCSCESFRAPLMVGAMRFEVFKKRLAECESEKPLLVVGCRKDHILHAMRKELPGIILTGVTEESLEDVDFSGYQGFVYASSEDTAETIRLLRLSVPVEGLLPKKDDKLKVSVDTLFDTAKAMLTESDKRGLAVYDKEDKFAGFITRRCFLSEPKTKLILVDHNEARQSVEGVEEAEIVEIVDHHRLDAPKTRNPISIITSPVGSTCTLIYEQYLHNKLEPTKEEAMVLLAGLVSDTVILKSPTTTALDRAVAKELCLYAEVSLDDFASELFSEGATLTLLDPEKAVSSDFKVYTEMGVKFGIGQVEVTSLDDAVAMKGKYLEALEVAKEKNGLNWAMLLVTNVLSENSILYSTEYKQTWKLVWKESEKGLYGLPGILSRKKQLLPEVLRTLED